MIKNFLEAVEENSSAALMVFGAIIITALILSLSYIAVVSEKTNIEMAKMGCSQRERVGNGGTLIWVCPNGVQDSK
jgi:hypothetical protein